MPLLVSQFVVYGLAWVVGWVIVREARRPITVWGLYCLLQAAGLWLLTQPTPGHPPATWPAAMLILLSYACANVGVDLFAHQGRMRWPGLWAGLLLAGWAVQIAGLLWPMPAHWPAVGYNLSAAALLLAPLLVFHRPLRHEFGFWGWLPGAPALLVGTLALLRCGQILANPVAALEDGPPILHSQPLLMASLFAAGAVNVSFLSLVVGRLVQRLHSLLDMDALTQLTNRGGLERRLAEAWAGSVRHGTGLSLAFIDINDFKRVNDLGGHEAGDQVIQAVAAALQHCARQTDHVGRWGGDEFLVVMPHTDPAAAHQAMQRLRERVHEAAIAMPLGCAPLSLSIGVATREPGDAQVQALVTRADAAMYQRKKTQADRTSLPQAGQCAPSHLHQAHP